MKKNSSLIVSAIFLVSLLLVFKYALAQSNPTIATAGDAIAVRIVPNPNHYSVSRWYESQGFVGSPQSLVVDGYEAIRDGRTVYVNAANIEMTSSANNIYTNIYLISYNQDPVPNTVDILGQIVSHWKFNGNLAEAINPLPSCSISSLSCLRDLDCGTGQFCATSGVASSSCQLSAPKNCLTDTDCPRNFFCDSVKAKITRDLKRVGKLEELKEALFDYKTSHSLYPSLSAGSYIAANTISVWPSWTGAFLNNLDIAQTFSDPINRLGACPGFDLKTCWNESTLNFWSGPYTDPQWRLTLPAGSYAFIYQTDDVGSNYKVCAVMESRELGFHFSPNDPIDSICVAGTGINTGGSATNTAPRLVAASLTGMAGQEFNGALKVVDNQNNPLAWSLNTSMTNWHGWLNTPGQAPILKDTGDFSQKKVYATQAGLPGNYNAVLTVDDGQGGILTTTTVISIINPAPAIQAADGEYILSPLVPFAYNFTFSGANITNPGAAYHLTRISGPFDLLNSSALTETVSSIGIVRYKVAYQGVLPLSYQFLENTNFVYQVTVTDNYGTVATKKFTIRIIVEKPELGFTCPTSARIGKAYSCFLGSNKQGDHTLAYTSGPLPGGLFLQFVTSTEDNEDNTNVSRLEAPLLVGFFERLTGTFLATFHRVNIARAISTSTAQALVYLRGTPGAVSTGWPIAIKAANEYGASSSRAFTLTINNYCGDGHQQKPNMENRGGLYNDGYEDCDGAEGVTTDVQNSLIELQYGCMTGVGAQTPPIIPNGNYCVFKSPLAGGGYCGDGYCQAEIVINNVTTTLETINNCSEDCSEVETRVTCSSHQHDESNHCVCDTGWYNCDGLSANGCENSDSECGCVRQCADRQCGSDGCGGSCGDCSCSDCTQDTLVCNEATYKCESLSHVCAAGSFPCGFGCCGDNQYCCGELTCVDILSACSYSTN